VGENLVLSADQRFEDFEVQVKSGVGLLQERLQVTDGGEKLQPTLRSYRDNPVCAGWSVN